MQAGRWGRRVEATSARHGRPDAPGEVRAPAWPPGRSTTLAKSIARTSPPASRCARPTTTVPPSPRQPCRPPSPPTRPSSASTSQSTTRSRPSTLGGHHHHRHHRARARATRPLSRPPPPPPPLAAGGLASARATPPTTTGPIACGWGCRGRGAGLPPAGGRRRRRRRTGPTRPEEAEAAASEGRRTGRRRSRRSAGRPPARRPGSMRSIGRTSLLSLLPPRPSPSEPSRADGGSTLRRRTARTFPPAHAATQPRCLSSPSLSLPRPPPSPARADSPPLPPRPKPFQRLNREILSFVAYISPSPTEHATRSHIVDLIRQAVGGQWRDATVSPFGSFETGLYLPTGYVPPPSTPRPLPLRGGSVLAPPPPLFLSDAL